MGLRFAMTRYLQQTSSPSESSAAQRSSELGRRNFLYNFGNGVGALALTSLLQRDGCLTAAESGGLSLRPSHVPGTAKSCIFMFMSGAPSQMDTFDPKPELNKLHGKPVTRIYGSREKRMYVACPFNFQKHGESGIDVSDIFPQLANCVDDMAVI